MAERGGQRISSFAGKISVRHFDFSFERVGPGVISYATEIFSRELKLVLLAAGTFELSEIGILTETEVPVKLEVISSDPSN